MQFSVFALKPKRVEREQIVNVNIMHDLLYCKIESLSIPIITRLFVVVGCVDCIGCV